MNPLFFNEYLAENYYRIHPAMAGVNLNGIRIDFGTRQQWFGVTDRPATNMLTLEYKTTAKTTLGFSGFSDQMAITVTTNTTLPIVTEFISIMKFGTHEGLFLQKTIIFKSCLSV